MKKVATVIFIILVSIGVFASSKVGLEAFSCIDSVHACK